MIAHVAAIGEDRGRVIVRLGALALSSAAALEGAIHVAKAFGSEIEGIFVQEAVIGAAGGQSTVRWLGASGNRSSSIGGAEGVQRLFDHFAEGMKRHLARRAGANGVAFKAQTVSDTVVGALQAACLERGPWNIIVFAEPVVGPETSQMLSDAVSQVWGTTGYLATGVRSTWRPGPIVVAVEDSDHLTGMIRAAQKLAAVERDKVMLVAFGVDEIAVDWLESEVRLLLSEHFSVELIGTSINPGIVSEAANDIERHKPRLVIARHGGLILPRNEASAALAQIDCPVFLVH